MITTSTVLILGAGASMPFGFPSGRALKEQLINSGRLPKALLECGFPDATIDQFFSALRKSARASVDEFLEHRTDFIEVGKAAIAHRLIQRENEAPLFAYHDGENWYEYLFKRMNASLERFSENRLSVVTYNYDRSLEHFLFNALLNAYGADPTRVASALSTIPIIHVHGQMGRLPWQPDALYGVTGQREYSTVTSPDVIRTAAAGIRIIHEDAHTEAFQAAHNVLRAAKRVYFIGFGYHRQNMERLRFADLPVNEMDIAGSFYGFSDAERAYLCRLTENKMMERGPANSRACAFLRNEATFQPD